MLTLATCSLLLDTKDMDAVNEVKARISIEDVIGEYVKLKRTGKNYKGLSPFTNERTPSFVVSPEKQIWHDFSSSRGGDMFSFIQEVEGLDFKGALELLARKSGVDLEQYQTKGRGHKGPDKERLHAVLDAAAKFYQVQLGANKAALEYVARRRAFSRQTILDFRIGYSPDTGRALTDYLLKKGFAEAEVKAAGLCVQRSGRVMDMFRGRIMVPLSDQFGKVVGFTARLLHDVEGAPKYINTPSTVLYDKSRHIYGLHLAKRAIQKEKFSVLVEGNLDVISSHQAGVANVVATAGTALTEMQLKILGRFSPDVRIAFDEDRAGLAATERAVPIASKTGVELSVITIPSGKDPDELVRQDPNLWRGVIQKHTYALDWLIMTYASRLDLESAVGKRQFSDAILPVVRSLEDQVEQDHYVHKIAQRLGVTSDSIRAKLSGVRGESPQRLKRTKPTAQANATDQLEAKKMGDRLLSLALMLPGIRGYLEELTEDMFVSDQAKKLFIFLKANPNYAGEQTAELRDLGEYVKIVSLQFEELYADVDTLELQYEAARLRTKLVELFVKYRKKQITERLADVDEGEADELLAQVRDLDQLLKRTKE
jgi:DNA primase